MGADGGSFFKEDAVFSFFEELWEGSEALVDEDKVALVLVHVGAHRAVGIVVVNEEAGDHEIDFREVKFFVATDKRGGVFDAVFFELLLAKSEGGGRDVVDPDVAGVPAEDEGFGTDSGTDDEDTLAEEEGGILSEPFREDAGGGPASIVVDVDSFAHFSDDFLLHPWVLEFHEGEGFAADEVGFKKRWHDVFGEY